MALTAGHSHSRKEGWAGAVLPSEGQEARARAPPRVTGGREGHSVQTSMCGDVGVILTATDVGLGSRIWGSLSP